MSFLDSREQLSPQGIGKSVPRREDARLLMGRGRYANDFNLPGQAYAGRCQDAVRVISGDVGGNSASAHARFVFPRLGGGSIVSPDPPAVGPHSVGYRLAEAALVFGGRTITATDCAVAAGIAEIGDNALAKVPPAVAAAVLDRARAMIEDAVDRMVSSALAGDRDERRSKDRRLTHHQHKTSG